MVAARYTSRIEPAANCRRYSHVTPAMSTTACTPGTAPGRRHGRWPPKWPSHVSLIMSRHAHLLIRHSNNIEPRRVHHERNHPGHDSHQRAERVELHRRPQRAVLQRGGGARRAAARIRRRRARAARWRSSRTASWTRWWARSGPSTRPRRRCCPSSEARTAASRWCASARDDDDDGRDGRAVQAARCGVRQASATFRQCMTRDAMSKPPGAV